MHSSIFVKIRCAHHIRDRSDGQEKEEAYTYMYIIYELKEFSGMDIHMYSS